jgi:MFS transporter, CP family, cyanate transporter
LPVCIIFAKISFNQINPFIFSYFKSTCKEDGRLSCHLFFYLHLLFIPFLKEHYGMNHPSSVQKATLIAGIVFVAFNLRPSITSVGPVIHSIRADLNISNGTAGFLTTLPLIAFALLSLVAPLLSRKWGNERTIFVGLFTLVCGILIRSAGTVFTVFFGTVWIGVGIAIGNVLLPGIVKEKFPEQAGLMTSIYTTSMNTFAAIGSAVSIPLADALNGGWKSSLSFWAWMSLAALCIWIPQVRSRNQNRPAKAVSIRTSGTLMWRSPLAWYVTFFMGLQSFLFYCTITWLPAILQSRGFSEETAGWMVSVMQLISLPATFATPVLANRLSQQKGIAFAIGLIHLAGIIGLFTSEPVLLYISIALIGIAQGASVSLALTLITLRTADAKEAAKLSGMSQSVGYLLAAFGPILLGYLFDATRSWVLSLVLLLAATVCLILSGLGAGRRGHVA